MKRTLVLVALVAAIVGCGPAPQSAPAAVPTAAPAPRTSFSDGIWLVGVDILPGTYRTTLVGGYCLWERLSGLSGTYADVIAWGAPPGGVAQQRLLGGGNAADRQAAWVAAHALTAIAPSDLAFSTVGCGVWSLLP